jgi:hypothetical protein
MYTAALMGMIKLKPLVLKPHLDQHQLSVDEWLEGEVPHILHVHHLEECVHTCNVQTLYVTNTTEA